MTKEELEEQRKKRLERFGPVPEADLQKSGEEGIFATKKMARCKHWPKCNYSDAACEFFHPTETCKFFPKCQYADNKCMFIHPEIMCKFGD